MDDAKRRGFQFAGVMGLAKGRAFARCQQCEGAVHTMFFAAIAYGCQVADKIKSAPQGDGGDWLGRLYQLPDTRN